MKKVVISLLMLFGLLFSVSAVDGWIMIDNCLVAARDPMRFGSNEEFAKVAQSMMSDSEYLVSESYVVYVELDELRVTYVFTSGVTQNMLMNEFVKGNHTVEDVKADINRLPWFGWNNSPSKGHYYLYADYMFK